MPTVAVIGPARSGTQLLERILTDGALCVYHDKTHGRGEVVEADRAVIIVRERHATVMSQLDMFGEDTRTESLVAIASKYPLGLWITYEQLCADLRGTIELIAAWLGIEPWDTKVIAENQNQKWGG